MTRVYAVWFKFKLRLSINLSLQNIPFFISADPVIVTVSKGLGPIWQSVFSEEWVTDAYPQNKKMSPIRCGCEPVRARDDWAQASARNSPPLIFRIKPFPPMSAHSGPCREVMQCISLHHGTRNVFLPPPLSSQSLASAALGRGS